VEQHQEPAPAGAREPGSDADYQYDEAHDLPGAGDRSAASRPVQMPANTVRDDAGDYGYDEAHDFGGS
jgi:hypothetical protein